MAGEGSRFKTCGYSIPKPLIPVSNKPMVILASDFLPQAERWIYLCRREHLDDFKIDQKIKEYKSSSIILSINQLTEGQACTCLYAKDYINNDDELFIAASDNGMIWDQDRFNTLKQECDCIIWTFRRYRHAADAPEAYGWALISSNLIFKTIPAISCIP
jgi:dTDP-glucose pyrophosphorylase